MGIIHWSSWLWFFDGASLNNTVINISVIAAQIYDILSKKVD